jgi:hypothetical protein
MIWEKGDYEEDKKGLWINPLYSRLDVAKIILFKKKYVCGVGEREEENMEVECTRVIEMENG